MGRQTCLTSLLLALLLTGGCGHQGRSDGGGQPSAGTTVQSGIFGTVHLGPTCPVERQPRPCDDNPARGSTVIVERAHPVGSSTALRVVARTSTDRAGRFRITLRPGRYVVTADAGMSCTPAALRVTSGTYTETDVRCDTGIR